MHSFLFSLFHEVFYIMPFHFKQFSIDQDNCAMKVSLDACLFGALCEVTEAQRILDIGTGTGLLALMAAQRCDAQIDAVELDGDAAQQAQQNVANSPFLSQVNVVQRDIKQYQVHDLYDVIMCNPPFFSGHLKGPDAQRNQARHNDGLSFSDLCLSIKTLLHLNGRAWILLPCTETKGFMYSALQNGLQLEQQWQVSSRPQKKAHRSIFSLSHAKIGNIQPLINKTHSLCVHNETGTEYTPEFKTLLCDYYLKL